VLVETAETLAMVEKQDPVVAEAAFSQAPVLVAMAEMQEMQAMEETALPVSMPKERQKEAVAKAVEIVEAALAAWA
jgi:hypothetical protein